MLDLTADLDYDAVGGLTLGADPVAAAMLHAAAARGRRLDAFVVRKAAKAHGLQRRIEGPDVAGRARPRGRGHLDHRRVAAHRGGGAAGGRRRGRAVVATIVDRGAAETVEAEGLRYFAAYRLADLGLD